jgi:2-C-methyl-D-erythritol 2,4-cyclodiphosphate synthase
MRIGIGHDTHRLVEGRPLILGGVTIEHSRGLQGHSDADIVLHAIVDALLGAAGLGDIGDAFPDNDPDYKGANSQLFVDATLKRLGQEGWGVVNVDVTIFAQEPRLGPIKPQIRDQVAKLLGLPTNAVNIKAKTGERLGHIGRAEALACHAVALIEHRNGKPAVAPQPTEHAEGKQSEVAAEAPAAKAKPAKKPAAAKAKPPKKGK